MPGLLVLLFPVACAFCRLDLPDPAQGMRVLERVESPYQSVRVVEEDRTGYRYLQVNEGLDSYQSAWRSEPGPLGEGFYYDLFALPGWWERPQGGSWRVLVLGSGAGSAARVISGASPPGLDLYVTAVELDPAVVELGHRWMNLAAAGGRWQLLTGSDARAALRSLREPFDLIVIDAYANQIEIPPHLSTVEFYEEARAHLADGGILALNVGGFSFDDPVVAAVGSTLASAWGGEPVLALRVPAARNYVLMAKQQQSLPVPGSAGFRVGGLLETTLVPLLEVPGAWRMLTAGSGPVLSDDLNPIELLQQLSIEQARSFLRGTGGASQS